MQLTTLPDSHIIKISGVNDSIIVVLAPSYLGAFKLTNSALGYILKQIIHKEAFLGHVFQSFQETL